MSSSGTRSPSRAVPVPSPDTDTQQPCAAAPHAGLSFSLKALLSRLGPGLITCASDDDPSGIGTYSQIGAQFGYGMLWTMLLSYPLMSAFQEICARIGRVTGHGIARNIRLRYPRLLYSVVALMVFAN